MKTLLKLLALLLVIGLALLLFIYSGVYNVAASSPDAGLVAWALRTTQERSVHRAYESLEGKVTIPRLDDPAMIQSGFVHYHEMCLTCHGGPGIKASEIGQGLNPFPPELDHAEEPLESFWIVKHGIKMTGMPGFGGTHTDDEIWAIVAFLDRLPKLSPEEYQAMVQQAGLGPPEKHEHGEHSHGEEKEEAGGHTHPPGTPAHTD